MLTIRPISNQDLDFLYHVENHPDYMKYGDHHEPYTLDTLKRFIVNAPRSIDTLGQLRYVIESSKQAVGFIDLYDYNTQESSAYVGIIIDHPFRRQSFGQMALQSLERLANKKWGIKILRVKVFLDNAISISFFNAFEYELVSKCEAHNHKGILQKALILEKNIQ